MKVIATIGSIKFEIEANNPKEVFQNLSFWANEWKTQCGHCDSKSVLPYSRTVKGNTFYTGKCQDCLWELDYGQLKDGSGLFPKGTWEAPYTPKSEAVAILMSDEVPPEYGGR